MRVFFRRKSTHILVYVHVYNVLFCIILLCCGGLYDTKNTRKTLRSKRLYAVDMRRGAL